MFVASVVVFSASTIAYFTDGKDDNLVISGDGSNLSGEIVEITDFADGSAPVVGPSPVRIVPGAKVLKTVTVKNTGSMGMYLRVTLDKEFLLSEANEGKTVDPDLVTFNLNTEYWELRDQFYYYKHALQKGETAEPLFTEVNFAPEMDNTYTNSTITFVIRAYATQIPADATSVFDVTGWPEEK